MEPQNCDHETQHVTNFMRPAPHPVEDESHLQEDRAVADPLADETILLWENTARKNREIFTELFRPVPTNLVRTKSAYKVGYDPRLRVPLFFADRRRVSELPSRCQERPCRAWCPAAAHQGEIVGSTRSPRRSTDREP
jgi:hypothetical protein